jgi:hypothetical protein
VVKNKPSSNATMENLVNNFFIDVRFGFNSKRTLDKYKISNPLA